MAGAHVPPHRILGWEVLAGRRAVGALKPGASPPAQHQGALTLGHVLLQTVLEVVVPPTLGTPIQS